MERQSRLADLKLVAKYYPVSNFSYPARQDTAAAAAVQYQQWQDGTERGSFGSDCSLPGMVDDRGSDISTEDDYQYHVSGAELWDSFWQANSPEENETEDVLKEQRESERQGEEDEQQRYPALIPSPATRKHQNRNIGIYGTEQEDSDDESCYGSDGDDKADDNSPAKSQTSVAAPAWPLKPSSPLKSTPSTPTKVTTKPAVYSLFPQTRKPAPAPSRPVLPPRKSSLPPTPTQPRATAPQRASNLSLPSIPAHQHPAASSTTDLILADYLALQQQQQQHHAESRPPPPVLAPTGIPDGYLPIAGSGSPTRAHFANPQPFARARATTLASPQPSPSPSRPASPAPVPVPYYRPVSPFTRGADEHPPPAPPPPPQPVSAFDDDSDSERSGREGESSFARRLVRGLGGRSASETRRSGKGADVARSQLARARAGTVTATAAAAASGGPVSPDAGEGKRGRGKERPKMARKESDVLGRMLGRWNH
jgi:hypothetical protein